MPGGCNQIADENVNTHYDFAKFYNKLLLPTLASLCHNISYYNDSVYKT